MFSIKLIGHYNKCSNNASQIVHTNCCLGNGLVPKIKVLCCCHETRGYTRTGQVKNIFNAFYELFSVCVDIDFKRKFNFFKEDVR